MRLILEDESRNTAAAIALACEQFTDPDHILLICPSDHDIRDTEKFRETMINTIPLAQDHIVCFGMMPDHPSTDYGYIEKGANHSINCFHEKPDSITAQNYIDHGYLWNSGIFMGRASIFHLELAQYYKAGDSKSFDYSVMEKTNRGAVVQADFSWSDVGTIDKFIAARDG